MAAATKEEFGPTLPELVRPRWRTWGRGSRVAAVVLPLVLLAVIGVLVVRGQGEKFSHAGSAEAPAFSFRHEGMASVPASGDELLRLEGTTDGQLVRRLDVAPVAVPESKNPIATTLPFVAAELDRQLATQLAGYRKVVEGRTRLNIVDGKEAYMIGFTATGSGPEPDGSLWVGKIFLVPEPGEEPRRAVALELLERVESPKVAEAVRNYPSGFLLNWPTRFWVQQRTSVDVPDELERPLKTFSFG